MNNRNKKILFFILFIGFLFVNIIPSLAAYDFKYDSGLAQTGSNDGAGYESTGLWSKSMPEIIGNIIKTVLSFLGVLFLVLMIYGGYTWMTARGNEQEIEKAKGLIKNAVIGLIIVLAAYAITAFIYWQLGIYYSDNRM